ncbi:hypothetical protein PVAG01_01053 [Phlyctema vagabunda]|uniref:Uncharacterized protein n=1 Tax=Phlyctema vagabunda TaxID=108571 RepID=A0ABR4PW02_9HELO
MEGGVRQIPGYYYDQEKKKYFKVTSGTGNSAYSSRDVKRRKVQDADAVETAHRAMREKDRIKRSKIMLSASAGGFLSSSYGHTRLGLVSEVFASQLVEQPKAPWAIDGGEALIGARIINPIFDIQHRSDLGPSTSDCHLSFQNVMASFRFNAEDAPEDCSEYAQYLNRTNDAFTHGMFTDTKPSSVSINESKGVVLSTWLAGEFNTGMAMSYIGPGPDLDQPLSFPEITVQMGLGFRRGTDGEVSIYSSAAAHPSSPASFVVGTSEGVAQIDNTGPNWILPKPPKLNTGNPFKIPRDVFALDFLQSNPTVLLSGGRSGLLNITDLRVPVFGSHADTIRHPSSITHIKQANDHRIIVAGLRSSLCQYDLRFRKHCSPQSNPLFAKTTTPYVEYHDYHNETLQPLGFDIDTDAGLVAAAQQSRTGVNRSGSLGGPIHLYSLRTGDLLRKIPTGTSSSTECNESGWVHSLKFARDSERGSRCSLYFGSSAFAGLSRYGWTDQ